MKKKHTPTTFEPEMDPTETSTLDPTADICSQLIQRYSSSSAPQHRHLSATAAAIKSLLLEDSLPLTPLSYFAATITSLSQPQNDAASASALATLLSIVLPLVPESSISPHKAADAAVILVSLLGSKETELLVGSTASAKCVVKSLGVLVGFLNSADWDSVELPLETLIKWSLDKRPKVRKCAVMYLENALKIFQSGKMKKKASKSILSLLESYMSIAVKLGMLQNVDGSGNERQYEAEQSDFVQVLNVVRVALPYLSDKISEKIILKLIELLDTRSSMLTRPVLNAIEGFLEKVEVGMFPQVAENIISSLSSYVSSNPNSEDSIISAASLLKISLDKLHARDTSKWQKSLSIGFNALAGLLTRDNDIGLKSSNILKNLIAYQLSDIELQPACDLDENDEESKAITSICCTFIKLLDSFAGVPNEHVLSVLYVLFLKLGHSSFPYTRNIVLKLADIFTHADSNKYDTDNLQKCFGCAVAAMGAENILRLVPVSFNVENLTYANMWMLPILKKYTCGASLGYFMEQIVPIAQSLQKASHKVKKVIRQELQAHAHELWGLLPAFCRHPTDVSMSFQSFAELLLVRLKKDSSMYEDIADALQELVKQNQCLPKPDAAIVESIKLSSDFSVEDYLLKNRNLLCYSKKAAAKNIKALSLYSHELLMTLMTLFLDATPEKRSSLKKAISCLASISDASITKKIFISSLERFSLVKPASVPGDSDPLDSASIGDNPQCSLILDLASSIVEGADEDLVGLIFRLSKHALQAGGGVGFKEAYHTLSCVLEEHPQFCSSKMDELVDLVIGLKSPGDIASFSNRLSSLQLLLVHALKSSSDAENTKPFLLLNEIILALKDSREEARSVAYDTLLRISSCLVDSPAANPDGSYHKLINMILGYLSGPSPHITSAAISALSMLVFKEPELCTKVPDVVSSVASLLQTKAVETIKAVLGFIKVLVSCLKSKDLQNFVPIIVDGIIPWSCVSRHHFRSKVTVILEIMIRKCGFPTIKMVTPERYQSFIKKVSQDRHGKSNEADAKPQPSDISTNGPKKRSYKETNESESGSKFQNKRRKYNQDSQSPGGTKSNVSRFDKKPNHFKHKTANVGQNQRGRNFGKPSSSAPMRHGPKNGYKGKPNR